MVDARRHAESSGLDNRCVLHRIRSAFQIQIVPIVVRKEWLRLLDLLHSLAPNHNLTRIMEWVRPQEDGVHYAENSGDRANSQSNSEHCRQCEAFGLTQLTKRIAKIMGPGFHRRLHITIS